LETEGAYLPHEVGILGWNFIFEAEQSNIRIAVHQPEVFVQGMMTYSQVDIISQVEKLGLPKLLVFCSCQIFVQPKLAYL